MHMSVLKKSKDSIEKNLRGKRHIITFGAGCWSYDIKKVIKSFGYDADYAFVDDGYLNGDTFMDKYGGNTKVVSLSEMKSLYDPKQDVIIWAIGNPARLREYKAQTDGLGDILLLWDTYSFWNDRSFVSKHHDNFARSASMLKDEWSVNTFWAYCQAQEGSIEDDVKYGYDGKTYFNDLTDKDIDGCFVDCGAFDGESAIGFLNFTGKEHKIYAFEPDHSNYKTLVQNAKSFENFVCINKGCYSVDTVLRFRAEADMASHFDENGGVEVDVTTIDHIIGEEKVAFIKMDIEGSELEALKGGRKVIERDMPILAISSYHRQEDFITLIPFICELKNKDYKYDIYLRHHAVTQTELVIYGIPVRVK